MKRPRAIISALAVVLLGATSVTVGASPTLAQAGPGSLAGIVHDTRGAAVSDATIVVYPADLAGSEMARTTTGTTGKFAVSPVAAGSYKILIDREGWSQWAPGRITDPAEAITYRVFAGHTTVAASIVTAPGLIAGRVTAPAGGPAPGITVTVDEPTLSSWSTTTAGDGAYSVSLPPGTAYTVSFTKGELTQYSPRTLDWTQAQRYAVTSGRTTRVNERLLSPAVLNGRFLNESGTPVAGARVDVAIVATAGAVWTTTGPDGRYEFAAMPPGDVSVGFTAPDGREQWAYRKTSGDQADLITLLLGTVTTVDETLLPPAAPAG